MVEHRRRGVVATRVIGKPEESIGVHRVGAMRLKCVRAYLVGEPDAATLLAKVEDGAAPMPGNLRLGSLELILAVAFQRPEDLAGDAFGMNANGHVCFAG